MRTKTKKASQSSKVKAEKGYAVLIKNEIALGLMPVEVGGGQVFQIYRSRKYAQEYIKKFAKDTRFSVIEVSLFEK
jgi:hypothetical protein